MLFAFFPQLVNTHIAINTPNTQNKSYLAYQILKSYWGNEKGTHRGEQETLRKRKEKKTKKRKKEPTPTRNLSLN